jgi:hypothetical protein
MDLRETQINDLYSWAMENGYCFIDVIDKPDKLKAKRHWDRPEGITEDKLTQKIIDAI